MEELNFDEDAIRKWVEPHLLYFPFFYDDDDETQGVGPGGSLGGHQQSPLIRL